MTANALQVEEEIVERDLVDRRELKMGTRPSAVIVDETTGMP
jgi:hypothetical protein